MWVNLVPICPSAWRHNKCSKYVMRRAAHLRKRNCRIFWLISNRVWADNDFRSCSFWHFGIFLAHTQDTTILCNVEFQVLDKLNDSYLLSWPGIKQLWTRMFLPRWSKETLVSKETCPNTVLRCSVGVSAKNHDRDSDLCVVCFGMWSQGKGNREGWEGQGWVFERLTLMGHLESSSLRPFEILWGMRHQRPEEGSIYSLIPRGVNCFTLPGVHMHQNAEWIPTDTLRVVAETSKGRKQGCKWCSWRITLFGYNCSQPAATATVEAGEMVWVIRNEAEEMSHIEGLAMGSGPCKCSV